jgi:iron complex outermembrane receptor protein
LPRSYHALAAASLSLAIAAPAAAQTFSFDVPAQEVRQIARQAKVQIMVAGRVAQGRRTQAVSGAMTVEQALDTMLAHTG